MFKASTSLILLALAGPALAQTAQPGPTPSPTHPAAPSVVALRPPGAFVPPAPGASQPAATPVAPAAGNGVPAGGQLPPPMHPVQPVLRNPLRPPVPAPAAAAVTPTVAPGTPTAFQGVVPPLPVPGQPPEEENPVKSSGKRIGLLNGKAIYKLENQYYFDKAVDKKHN